MGFEQNGRHFADNISKCIFLTQKSFNPCRTDFILGNMENICGFAIVRRRLDGLGR